MTKFYATLLSFVATAPKKDEKGATAVEYGLLVALVAVAIIAAVSFFGDSLTAVFDKVADALGGGSGTPGE